MSIRVFQCSTRMGAPGLDFEPRNTTIQSSKLTQSKTYASSCFATFTYISTDSNSSFFESFSKGVCAT
jgi:hypothetical protein